jgi:hypothetical protein
LVDWLPVSPGSAVCKATNRLVSGDDAALSARLAIAVALKISFRMSFSKVSLLDIKISRERG